MNLPNYIEHTVLKPTVTDKEIDQLVKEARDHEFYGVCVPPFWVKRAKREIGSSDVKLVTVAGFPLGYQMTEVKLEELKISIVNGADELDVVMNISAFKINMDWFKIDLAKCARLCHDNGKLIKIIIETAYLTKEEIVRACKIAADAGADFVKTSTGFAGHGATSENVKLMRDTVGASVGVKASGGIKTYEHAIAMINAGADRIGTSSGVEMVRGIKN
ncbi:MAG: deoxyribose-phosphate aldolase [Cytophagaceae bacterium]